MTDFNPNDSKGSNLNEISILAEAHTNSELAHVLAVESTLTEIASLPENIPSSVSDRVPAPSDPFIERLTHAIQLHMDGVAGNVIAVQKAHQYLEQLRVDYPNNPLVDAYYGSTMILIARDKPRALDKLKWSNNGLKILDNAVAADPHDGAIRLLRGKNAYNLPEKYFHRAKTVIEDYTLILEQHADLLEADEQLQLIYELGDAYTRIGRNHDAATYLRSLESQTQNPAWQQLATQKLQALEGKPAVETISNESPTSMLIDATRSVSSALLNWADDEKKKKLAEQKAKERAKERAIEKAKEEAKEKAIEKARERAREKAKEKERESLLEREKEKEKEKERERERERAREMALEKEKSKALEKEKETPVEKQKPKSQVKPIEKPSVKPIEKPSLKPVSKVVTTPVAKQKTKQIARSVPKPATKPSTKPSTKPLIKKNAPLSKLRSKHAKHR